MAQNYLQSIKEYSTVIKTAVLSYDYAQGLNIKKKKKKAG